MRAEQHQPCGALSWRRRRTHGCRKQLRVSGCHKQLRRSQLVRAVSPMSTTRLGCGGQKHAPAAGAPAPCSASAHVRPPPQQAAPAATHVCSRTHDLRMRERPIETPHRRVWLEARGGRSAACPMEPSGRSAWRVALMRAEQRPPHAAAQQLAHARPTTPRHPPTNPLAAPSSGAHVPLTVGTRAVVLVASCGTRTRSAARAIEQRVRSAWRASAMRAQQHQPCGALSWSRRRTHGCRKQLRVSGRREQLRRSQLVHAVSPTSTTKVQRSRTKVQRFTLDVTARVMSYTVYTVY